MVTKGFALSLGVVVKIFSPPAPHLGLELIHQRIRPAIEYVIMRIMGDPYFHSAVS